MNRYLALRADVREALEGNEPVVALETTVIAHGLPRPLNLENARLAARTAIAYAALGSEG